MDAQFSKKVHIVAADNSGKETASISLPSGLWNAQLFLSDGKLIVIGSKNNPSISYRSSMVALSEKIQVVMYDVNTPSSPKLLSAYEYDGYLQESRLTDGRLVLITSQPITWGPIFTARDEAMSSAQPKTIDADDFTFAARDILPTRTAMRPSVITINGKQSFRTAKTSLQPDCTNVYYHKPTAQAKNYPMW